ncbi:MAG: hypothetical protein HYS32_02005 [Candidatus Woesearchaeota archaeon]|nr:MAG: hypothetical protein HYS32_02005 [Candidatus Woesearchaeota archaeon]
MHKNYFEAIIQVRPFKEEVLDFIRNQVKKSEKDFISKEVKLKEGVDVYVSSRKLGVQIARKLKRSFKGEVKVTKSIYGYNRAKSKHIHRLTILFRLE